MVAPQFPVHTFNRRSSISTDDFDEVANILQEHASSPPRARIGIAWDTDDFDQRRASMQESRRSSRRLSDPDVSVDAQKPHMIALREHDTDNDGASLEVPVALSRTRDTQHIFLEPDPEFDDHEELDVPQFKTLHQAMPSKLSPQSASDHVYGVITESDLNLSTAPPAAKTRKKVIRFAE